MRTILTTIALVVALAAPAQAQDLRSPDARGASPSADQQYGAVHQDRQQRTLLPRPEVQRAAVVDHLQRAEDPEIHRI